MALEIKGWDIKVGGVIHFEMSKLCKKILVCAQAICIYNIMEILIVNEPQLIRVLAFSRQRIIKDLSGI